MAAILLMAGALHAQDGAATHRHSASATASAPPSIAIAGLRIPDVTLLNQRGEKVRLYSDLIEGRIAAINTIFTSCTTICPVMGANFSQLQKSLSKAHRHDVSLISISVDPLVDTPERLTEWMRGFGGSADGWTLLTGPKGDIETALKALQVFKSDKSEHSPVVLIGGERMDDWVRASALLPAARLAELIDSRRPRSPTQP